MAELESCEIQLISVGDGPSVLDDALAVLEDIELLVPTRWGLSEGVRDPYDRAVAIAAYRQKPDSAPSFLRTAVPGRYSGSCYEADVPVTALRMSSRDEMRSAAVSAFCDAVANLAGQLSRLDFGSIDISFQEMPREARMHPRSTVHHLGTYVDNGPSALFARNFFGARLVELAGGEGVFAESGFDVRRLPNGSIRFDLLERPWAQDPLELKSAQGRALLWLRDVGLLAKIEDDLAVGPGPRWVPPA